MDFEEKRFRDPPALCRLPASFDGNRHGRSRNQRQRADGLDEGGERGAHLGEAIGVGSELDGEHECADAGAVPVDSSTDEVSTVARNCEAPADTESGKTSEVTVKPGEKDAISGACYLKDPLAGLACLYRGLGKAVRVQPNGLSSGSRSDRWQPSPRRELPADTATRVDSPGIARSGLSLRCSAAQRLSGHKRRSGVWNRFVPGAVLVIVALLLVGTGSPAMAQGDTTGPMVVSAEMERPNLLILEFDEHLADDTDAPVSAFEVVSGGSTLTVDRTAPASYEPGQNRRWYFIHLHLEEQVVPGTSTTVSYEKPGTNPVQDVNGNDAPDFTGLAVSNPADNVVPTVPAGTLLLHDASVENLVSVNFSEQLDRGSLPDKSAFAVTVNGTDSTVTSVAWRAGGSGLNIYLSANFPSGALVTVTYTKPSLNPLQDLAAHALPSLTVFPTLIGNLDRTVRFYAASAIGHVQDGEQVHGIVFTTGNVAAGYQISDAVIRTRGRYDGTAAQCAPRLSIYRAILTLGDAQPDPTDRLYVLTSPATFDTGGDNAFRAPADARLASQTEYALVVECVASNLPPDRDDTFDYGPYHFNPALPETGEPAADGAAGWSWANTAIRREVHRDAWENYSGPGRTPMFAITGSIASGELGIVVPTSYRVLEEDFTFRSYRPSSVGSRVGDLTWSLEGTDAEDFTIDAATGDVSMVPRDYENPVDENEDNVYEVTLRATDEAGNSATTALTVTVVDNFDIVITGFGDHTVEENTAFTTTPSTLFGNVLGFRWSIPFGPDHGRFTIDQSTGVVSMVARDYENPVDANRDNVYEAEVYAQKNDGRTRRVPITVTVTDVAELSVTGLSDRTVAENLAFTSPAPSVSGASGGVTWSKEGTDAAAFTIDAATGVVSMVARDYENPVDGDTNNVYEVTVRATDGNGASATVSFTVTVTDAREIANLSISGLPNRNVAENSAFTSARPSVSGAVGGVTWSKEGADAADFSINASTGVLSMVGRDYENPADANRDNVYAVTVKVTDADANTATASFTVTVTDVQETANLSITGLSEQNVAENRAFTSPRPSVSGAVGGVTWSKEGADAADFSINASAGVLSMVGRDYENPADANGDNVYAVTVRVTDADANTATASFTVTVANVRETAALGITGPTDRSISENEAFASSTPTLTGTPNGDVVWTIEGTDATDFTINPSTGLVSMVGRNFESPEDANRNNVYEVTLRVTDADENTAAVSFTVTVTNVRETVNLGVTGLSNGNVAENMVFMSSEPVLSGTPIGEVAWTVEGDDAADFSVDETDGVVSMAARDFESPVDADADNVYEVTVRATDDDENTVAESFTVTVTDVRETVTLGITGLGNRNIAENSAFTSSAPRLTGTPIGEVVWTIEGSDASDFSVDDSTGAVSMVARDFEDPVDADTDNDYAVTVRATDDDDNQATASFTVTVTDVREAATLGITGLSNRSVAENAAFRSPTPVLTGTPIGNVEWTVEGADAPDFSIDGSSGVVSMVARDFESPADADRNNVYSITVRVSDDDDNRATASFTVTVTDVQETVNLGVTGFADMDVAENTAFTSSRPGLSGTPIGDVAWTIEGSDAADFSVSGSTGVVSMVRRNFESPVDADADNVYEVTVRITDDDDNTATASFTVTVTDVAERVSLGISGLGNRIVAENTKFTSPVPGLSGTPIGNVEWTIEGVDAADFTVSASTGVVTMAARNFESPVDDDADNDYEVTVRVTDDDNNTAAVSFTVTVTNALETATLGITGLSNRNVAENTAFTSAAPTLTGTPIGSVRWTVEGTDAADFTVSARRAWCPWWRATTSVRWTRTRTASTA